MSVALQVVLLVAGIVAVLALIAVPIVLGYRRKYRAAAQRAAANIEAEGVLRAFEKGVYRGASAPGYPAVKNTGRIALTRRRLVFVTLTGTTIEIPLASITDLRTSKVFQGSVAGGWTHLVVRTSAGEVGFFVEDLPAWMQDLTTAAGVAPDQP
jgi:type II secretory pathway pseudopilin PulG